MKSVKLRPVRLFQEDLCEQPFWMLVACSLVNLTTWDKARPVFRQLFLKYRNPEALAFEQENQLHDLLRPLGLWNRRSRTLVRMATAFISVNPKTASDVLKIPGCGKYASDSWAIFIDKDYYIEPEDGRLAWYLSQRYDDISIV